MVDVGQILEILCGKNGIEILKTEAGRRLGRWPWLCNIVLEAKRP